MEIRLLDQTFLDDLTALDAACFHKSWSRESWRAEIDAAHILGAFCQKRLVGVLDVHQLFDEAELYKIFVADDFRKQGVGCQLWAVMVDMLHKRQVTRVFLEVAEKNQAAINFYKKLGFIQNGYRHDYYDDPPDNAILQVLELSP